jgi:hypothetical protein
MFQDYETRSIAWNPQQNLFFHWSYLALGPFEAKPSWLVVIQKETASNDSQLQMEMERYRVACLIATVL